MTTATHHPEVADLNGATAPGPEVTLAHDSVPEPVATARRAARGGRADRRRRKRAAWSAAAVAVLALLAWSLRPTPLVVETVDVLRGPLEVTVNAEGVTRARDRYEVAAPVTGRLERIPLRPGDAITAGMPLARVTPMPLDPAQRARADAQLAAVLAGVTEADVRVAQTRETLEQADRSTARLRAVAGLGAISVEAMELAELQLESARSEHDAAVARAAAGRAEAAAARAALLGSGGAPGGESAVVIRAPAAGRVFRVHEENERVIAAGTPLLSIGDAQALEVRVDVLSTDAVRVQPGALMRLFDWGGSAALDATVRQVEPQGFTRVSTLGIEEQRVNVIADLHAPPPGLGDGYRVQASIVTWSGPDVLKVPNSALFRTRAGWSVFVVADGRARVRDVTPGQRGALETEILAGLESGERVIRFPSDRVTTGARVRSGS